MKTPIFIIIALFVITAIAHADYEYEEKSDCVGEYTSEEGRDSRHLHDHCYENTDRVREKRKSPVGVGLDIPLWKSEKFDVVNENKYDGRNDEYSNYTVVQLKSEKGLFQYIGSFFKKLFNREGE